MINYNKFLVQAKITPFGFVGVGPTLFDYFPFNRIIDVRIL